MTDPHPFPPKERKALDAKMEQACCLLSEIASDFTPEVLEWASQFSTRSRLAASIEGFGETIREYSREFPAI